MLTRYPSPPLVLYRSVWLDAAGCPHAFTTRIGGRSPAPWRSFDLNVSADAAHAAAAGVMENYRALQRALDVPDHALAWARQVHGAAVAVIEGPEQADEHPEADALLTAQPGVLLSVRAADCVPVLLAGRDGRAVAAVHAGWRGVIAGVVPAAVVAMSNRFGIAARDLVAAVGPCISRAHFEVGPEVAAAFRDAGLGDAVDADRASAAGASPPGAVPGAAALRAGPRPHVDLPAAVVMQLAAAGVPRDAVDATDRCTFRDVDEFYSHRRDRGQTGRMAAVIAVKNCR